MATAFEVAEYFLTRGDDADDSGMSNLKLQKLVYYAQGFHLALHDQPLFAETIEAWPHGPVCPVVYHKYKKFGAGPIDARASVAPDTFSAEQVELLDEVYEVFGQYSAWKLRNMTHEEAPWQEHEATGSPIPAESMQRFFKTRIR